MSVYYLKSSCMLFMGGLMVAIAIEHSNLHRWAINIHQSLISNLLIHSKAGGAEGSADGRKFPQAGAARLHATNCHPLHVDL